MTSAKPHIRLQNCTGCVRLCSGWYCDTIKDTQFPPTYKQTCISYTFKKYPVDGSVFPTQMPTHLPSSHELATLFQRGSKSAYILSSSFQLSSCANKCSETVSGGSLLPSLVIKLRKLSSESVILKGTEFKQL